MPDPCLLAASIWCSRMLCLAALLSAVHCRSAWITIRRQDQALDSFEASACSSLHTLNDASLLVLTYTEKRQLRAKAGRIWAWLDGIARGRARARRQLESDPQTSTQEAPAIAELRPPAAGSGRGGAMGAWGGAGRGAPGIWILGTPFLGTPVGVLVSSERPRAFRCHPYPQVWHWGL